MKRVPSSSATAEPAAATRENIQTVVELERATRLDRSALERMTDVVSSAASSTAFIGVHVIWFVAWIGVNLRPTGFDRYPFSLLTLIVSLEAILLTGFLLISQDRMTKVADRRAHLDLQVNLLAEQELTAILRVVCAIAEDADIELKSVPNLERLLSRTDVRTLNDQLSQEMAAADRIEGASSRAKT